VSLSLRELWTVLHGLVLGSLFLLAFAGGLAGLYSLRPEWVTVAGVRERMQRLLAGTWLMAVVAWLTVISGTYIVYPWYRARPPEGASLADYPRYLLLSKPTTAAWHTFGMEWKEHVAWFAPILTTAVAFVVSAYGAQLARDDRLRKVLIWMFILGFIAAGIAGVFGAFINKIAPIR
jgi:lipopolysaccharide export LptBFGC system permease protein LptF